MKNMIKKLMAILVFGFAGTVLAAHQHCICGTGTCTVGGHVHDHEVTWTEWTATDSLPTTAGNWYLANDVTLTAEYVPVTGVNLCLNGHTVTQTTSGNRVINVCNSGSSELVFALTDCTRFGKITGGDIAGSHEYGAGVNVKKTSSAKSVFKYYGGIICGNTTTSVANKGSGCGGGACVDDGCEFYMYGGVISNNTATSIDNYTGTGRGGGLFVSDTGKAFVYGGDICYNTANRYGGGVEIGSDGSKTPMMTFGGTARVFGNTGHCGGGICCDSGSQLTVAGGEVFDNSASGGILTGGDKGKGGGIFLCAGPHAINDCSIYNNTAAVRGGGLYYDDASAVTIGGVVSVTNNTVGGAIENAYIISGKKVTLSSLASGSKIGVTLQSAPAKGAKTAFTTNGSTSDLAKFTSDDATYFVVYDTDHLALEYPSVVYVEVKAPDPLPANTTFKVFTNGVEITKTGDKYLVPTNSTDVTVVFKADDGYYFDDGTTEKVNEVDASKNPAKIQGSIPSAPTQPLVTSVTARQRYPWNGKVDISYAVTSVVASAVAQGMNPAVSVMAIDCSTEPWTTNVASSTYLYVGPLGVEKLTDVVASSNGVHQIVWDMNAQGLTFKSTNLVFVVSGEGKARCVQMYTDGPYWADCNLGANKPEESGDFFWWGDTVGYKRNSTDTGWEATDGSTNNFLFSSSNKKIVTYGIKPYKLDDYGYAASANGPLLPAYDAAVVKLGGAWRMPTPTEVYNLYLKSTKARYVNWKGTGVEGFLVTGVGQYASNSIFFPITGYAFGSGFDYYSDKMAVCWTSGLENDDSNTYDANALSIKDSAFYYAAFGRQMGYPIRPVCDSPESASAVLCRGEADAVKVDLAKGVRIAAATEMLTYSAAWCGGTTACLAVNGVTLEGAEALSGTGTFAWTPSIQGTNVVTHTVVTGGVSVVETAKFVVRVPIVAVPTLVAHTTVSVYTNGALSSEVESGKWAAWSNETATVVYTAAPGYSFADGSTVKTNVFDTSKNPATAPAPSAPLQFVEVKEPNPSMEHTTFKVLTNGVEITKSGDKWLVVSNTAPVEVVYEADPDWYFSNRVAAVTNTVDATVNPVIDANQPADPLQYVQIIPETVPNTTYKVYLDDEEITPPPYYVPSNAAPVKIVYEADPGYNFPDGSTVKTNTLESTATGNDPASPLPAKPAAPVVFVEVKEPNPPMEHTTFKVLTNGVEITKINDKWLVPTNSTDVAVVYVAEEPYYFTNRVSAITNAVDATVNPVIDANQPTDPGLYVRIIPEDVPNTTHKVYWNDQEITPPPYYVPTNASPVKIIYEADPGFYFPGGNTAKTNELESSATGTDPATLPAAPAAPMPPIKYVAPVYKGTDNNPTNGIAYWVTNTVYGSIAVMPSTSAVEWNGESAPIWYVVTNDVTIAGGAACLGDVNLILCDGAKLTVTVDDEVAGIATDPDGSFTVYAQENGTGALEVTGGERSAAIGGSKEDVGNSSKSGDNITLNGGSVTAFGGKWAAAIGGSYGGNGVNIVINGGTVKAIAGELAAAIGGGQGNETEGLVINGGTIAVLGNSDSDLIGRGKLGHESSDVLIAPTANILFSVCGETDPLPTDFEGFVVMTPMTQSVDRVLVTGFDDSTTWNTFSLTNLETGAAGSLAVNGHDRYFAARFLSLTNDASSLVLKSVEAVEIIPEDVPNTTYKVYRGDEELTPPPYLVPINETPVTIVYTPDDGYTFPDGTTAKTNAVDTSTNPATVLGDLPAAPVIFVEVKEPDPAMEHTTFKVLTNGVEITKINDKWLVVSNTAPVEVVYTADPDWYFTNRVSAITNTVDATVNPVIDANQPDDPQLYVQIIPEDVPNTTYKVYLDDKEITPPPYYVPSNAAPVKIVYETDPGYNFPDGSTVKTNTLESTATGNDPASPLPAKPASPVIFVEVKEPDPAMEHTTFKVLTNGVEITKINDKWLVVSNTAPVEVVYTADPDWYYTNRVSAITNTVDATVNPVIDANQPDDPQLYVQIIPEEVPNTTYKVYWNDQEITPPPYYVPTNASPVTIVYETDPGYNFPDGSTVKTNTLETTATGNDPASPLPAKPASPVIFVEVKEPDPAMEHTTFKVLTNGVEITKINDKWLVVSNTAPVEVVYTADPDWYYTNRVSAITNTVDATVNPVIDANQPLDPQLYVQIIPEEVDNTTYKVYWNDKEITPPPYYVPSNAAPVRIVYETDPGYTFPDGTTVKTNTLEKTATGNDPAGPLPPPPSAGAFIITNQTTLTQAIAALNAQTNGCTAAWYIGADFTVTEKNVVTKQFRELTILGNGHILTADSADYKSSVFEFVSESSSDHEHLTFKDLALVVTNNFCDGIVIKSQEGKSLDTVLDNVDITLAHASAPQESGVDKLCAGVVNNYSSLTLTNGCSFTADAWTWSAIDLTSNTGSNATLNVVSEDIVFVDGRNPAIIAIEPLVKYTDEGESVTLLTGMDKTPLKYVELQNGVGYSYVVEFVPTEIDHTTTRVYAAEKELPGVPYLLPSNAVPVSVVYTTDDDYFFDDGTTVKTNAVDTTTNPPVQDPLPNPPHTVQVISYDAMDGAWSDGVTVSNIEATLNQRYVLPAAAPVRARYTFKGWYASWTNGAAKIENGDPLIVNLNHSIYAKWISAEYPEGEDNTFNHLDLDDETVVVTGVKTNDDGSVSNPFEGGRLDFPERIDNTLDGKVVTWVGRKAFAAVNYDNKVADDKKLTSVSLSTFITDIGDQAFQGATKLTNVNFVIARDYKTNAKTVLDIGSRAFANTAVETVVIPAGAKVKLRENAFANCAKLKEIFIYGEIDGCEKGPFNLSGSMASEIVIHLSPKAAADAAFVANLTSGLNTANVKISTEPLGKVANLSVPSFAVPGEVSFTFKVAFDSPWGEVNTDTVTMFYTDDLSEGFVGTGKFKKAQSVIGPDADGTYQATFEDPAMPSASQFFRITVGN